MMRACLVRLALVACVLVGIALLTSSCGHDRSTDPNHNAPNRVSPESLLVFFAESLEHRDLTKYQECLDDAYTFRFTEEDWDPAEVTADQPYWGLTEDVTRTQALFTSTQVTSITFDWGPAVLDFSGPDTLLQAIHDPVIDVTVSNQGEEPKTCQVRQSRMTLVVVPDRHSEGLWVIRSIREDLKDYVYAAGPASSSATVQPSTFGSIKAMFK